MVLHAMSFLCKIRDTYIYVPGKMKVRSDQPIQDHIYILRLFNHIIKLFYPSDSFSIESSKTMSSLSTPTRVLVTYTTIDAAIKNVVQTRRCIAQFDWSICPCRIEDGANEMSPL